jgi:hypothetical protein
MWSITELDTSGAGVRRICTRTGTAALRHTRLRQRSINVDDDNAGEDATVRRAACDLALTLRHKNSDAHTLTAGQTQSTR